jgi:type II secretory pathway pseudopilin PulG
MTRRPAVTLIEVLVAMFIMAIGMLALLVLFPLGALTMGQALKDDRCASAAFMAEQTAIAMNVRHDANVTALFTAGLPANYPVNYPSNPVYVDPYFAGTYNQVGTSAPFIHRVRSIYAGSPPLWDRWFSLPNDITFLSNGTPDPSGGNVERARRYTWAYMLRRPQAWTDDAVDLTVVVYNNRPTAAPIPEQTYAATGAATGAGLGLSWNPASQPSPNLKRGIWILDTTPIPGTAIPQAVFYRVVNITDTGTGSAALDVQPNLANNVSQVVVMDHVAEVFAKGSSWQP